MELRGPHLTLKLPGPDDAPALFELARDPAVTRWFSWGPYEDMSEAAAFIERMAHERDAGERLEFVIAGPDDVPLGITGLSEFSQRDRRAVIGTWLGRSHWGTGANRESKDLVLHLAFETLGLRRLSAYAHPENERSLRSLAKFGFVQEGVLVDWHLHGGEWRDVAILRLLADDWRSAGAAGGPVTVEGEAPARISAGKQSSA
jgi:[ribosomal protein S5]-alanine N-acetyltransferase